jgi:hypothetical protein
MFDTLTENNLKKMVKPVLDNAQFYQNLMKNCSQYMVKPNGNKFWLTDNWILAEWKDCQNTNPFESWKYPTAKIAKDNFKAMAFDNNW